MSADTAMANTFLFHFFHNETNDRTERGLVHIPKDIEDWPEAWKKIEYKQYPFFPPIQLSQHSSPFFELLSQRRSRDGGHILQNKVTPESLGNMLRCGYGLRENTNNDVRLHEKRTVPSAGGRYPLELYPILFKDVGAIRAGTYHYGLREHVLELITVDGFGREELKALLYQDWFAGATGMICITAVLNRTTRKYGSRGYRYALLEAGHVAQNILLAATESGLDAIPVGGIDEVGIERRIGLTGSNERIIYTLFF